MTLGFAILRRKWTIFLAVFRYFCSILSGIKYYPPSLPLFSEPLRVSDSFENRLNSKSTKLRLSSYQSKWSRIREFWCLHTSRKKSEIKPLLFDRVCGDIWNVKLERRIRKLLNPGRFYIVCLVYKTESMIRFNFDPNSCTNVRKRK